MLYQHWKVREQLLMVFECAHVCMHFVNVVRSSVCFHFHIHTYTLHVPSFTEQDSFVGYQNDTPAAVVFQATEQLREEQEGEVNEGMEESDEWLDQVMERSKSLLVQMASPDALIRLQRTQLPEEERKSITAMYTEQHHDSVKDFLCHHLKRPSHIVDIDDYMGLLLHVSKSCSDHSHTLL